MKTAITVTIDTAVALRLRKMDINVSALCNDALKKAVGL